MGTGTMGVSFEGAGNLGPKGRDETLLFGGRLEKEAEV